MSSLKEIKNRITSVTNTLKITTAMKLVASAKLHRIQNISTTFQQYASLVKSMSASLCARKELKISTPLNSTHDTKNNVVVIAISSDSSLCGAFNQNLVKAFNEQINSLKEEGFTSIKVYTIGEKIHQAISKIHSDTAPDNSTFEICHDFTSLSSKPEYTKSTELADLLMETYTSGKADRICIVYNHFKSMARQIPTQTILLPFAFADIKVEKEPSTIDEDEIEYICEPPKKELMEELLPYMFRITLFETFLNSSTAEHAARTVAMQTASDNAQDLLDELSLTYNKNRQKAITDELSDITQV